MPRPPYERWEDPEEREKLRAIYEGCVKEVACAECPDLNRDEFLVEENHYEPVCPNHPIYH